MKTHQFASIAAALTMSAYGCAKQPSKEVKLRMSMESAPFLAPMANDDLSDPQSGYKHQTFKISGGNYFYVKEGSSRVREPSNPQPLKFTEMNLYGESQPEIAPGFKPGAAYCTYGTRRKDKWACLIFRSAGDAETYVRSSSYTVPVTLIACFDCKPVADPSISRICPGNYVSWLHSEDNWEDQMIPGQMFNEEGNCSFDKPWWRTEEGIKLGVEKYSDMLR